MMTKRARWAAVLASGLVGCYEPVPDFPNGTSTAGSATAGSTASASTAASAGSTTGANACEPTNQTETIDCGMGKVCSPNSQACCYTFIGVMPPELACDCPDACGPNASEFRCDGPEDCPGDELCCAMPSGDATRASCVTDQACFSGMGVPLCQTNADCQIVGPNATCTLASDVMADDIPPFMRVCIPDIFTPCMNDNGCPQLINGTTCVRPSGGTNSICAPPCNVPDDCPPLPGASAPPVCGTVEGNPQNRCVFTCMESSECAFNQICAPALVNGQIQTICLWPTTDGGSG